MKTKNGLIKNLYYAFGAQGISLILSLLMSMIVPRFLGVVEFGYWQLFLFYAGYVGFCQFGLQDGMYLRLGGKKIEDINLPLIGMQLKISILIQTILGIIAIILFKSIYTDGDRLFIWICTVIYMIVSSLNGYITYVCQAINKIREYSISIIIDKITFIILIIGLIATKERFFEKYVIFFLVGKCVSTIYCIYIGRKIVFTKYYSISKTFKEMWTNVSVGIKLMVANIASMLIIGFSRMIVDRKWGIEEFGKLSFSLSLANFFLLFVSQASMVLFPSLRRVDEQELKRIYIKINRYMIVFLPIAFVFYYPIKILLNLWLPKYSVSVLYLALLLPIIIYDGKMNLLCNTYFKVLRKEKFLLKINSITMILSLILGLVSVYIFNNIICVVISIVIAIAFRSIVSEIYLSRIMNEKITKYLCAEGILIICFMIIAYNLEPIKGMIIYCLIYLIYLVINKQSIKQIFKSLRL